MRIIPAKFNLLGLKVEEEIEVTDGQTDTGRHPFSSLSFSLMTKIRLLDVVTKWKNISLNSLVELTNSMPKALITNLSVFSKIRYDI